MIAIELHSCFGLSIEANDVVCYMIRESEDSDKVVLIQFDGVIIILPLLKIHIGSFTEIEED
jgi:hypothetical protein